MTRVRCAVGAADGFKINVELYQGPAPSLERWRYALEKSGSRSRKECMCVNERTGQVVQGVEVVKVDDYKYLRSTVQSNGERRREVKKRVKAEGSGWRRV